MNLCKCGCGQECNKTWVVGHNGRGVERSPEEITKFRTKILDPDFNKNWREKMRNSWTEEKKEKYRKNNLGKTLSEEHKEKIGKGNTGKIRSEEVKKRISNTLKGISFVNGNPMKNKNIAKSFRGENNGNWKGGTSREYKTGYYSTEYKEWRNNVFKRDNYTCQECGVSRVYLTAHHIKSFSKFPELRFDIQNGITLCTKCHSKTDNYKGRNKKVLTY